MEIDGFEPVVFARAVEADNGEAAGHGDDRHGRLAADILLIGHQGGSIIVWLYRRSSTSSRMNRCRRLQNSPSQTRRWPPARPPDEPRRRLSPYPRGPPARPSPPW